MKLITFDRGDNLPRPRLLESGSVYDPSGSCARSETPFVEGYPEKDHGHAKDKVREQLVARQPIGRLGTAEDVASLVRYLCSEEASFVNGTVVSIDGGWTAA